MFLAMPVPIFFASKLIVNLSPEETFDSICLVSKIRSGLPTTLILIVSSGFIVTSPS